MKVSLDEPNFRAKLGEPQYKKYYRLLISSLDRNVDDFSVEGGCKTIAGQDKFHNLGRKLSSSISLQFYFLSAYSTVICGAGILKRSIWRNRDTILYVRKRISYYR
jgi:hypothetical protein